MPSRYGNKISCVHRFKAIDKIISNGNNVYVKHEIRRCSICSFISKSCQADSDRKRCNSICNNILQLYHQAQISDKKIFTANSAMIDLDSSLSYLPKCFLKHNSSLNATEDSQRYLPPPHTAFYPRSFFLAHSSILHSYHTSRYTTITNDETPPDIAPTKRLIITRVLQTPNIPLIFSPSS